MTSHVVWLVVFAFCVSAVFGALLRDAPREQLKTGAFVFAGFLAAAILIGWVMYPLPL